VTKIEQKNLCKAVYDKLMVKIEQLVYVNVIDELHVIYKTLLINKNYNI